MQLLVGIERDQYVLLVFICLSLDPKRRQERGEGEKDRGGGCKISGEREGRDYFTRASQDTFLDASGQANLPRDNGSRKGQGRATGSLSADQMARAKVGEMTTRRRERNGAILWVKR